MDDLNDYLKHFGDAAVYYEAAETPHNIKAIFNRTNFEDFTGKQNSNLYATVKVSDVPNIGKNKKFKRGTADYYIINWQIDEENEAIYKLELSRTVKQ